MKPDPQTPSAPAPVNPPAKARRKAKAKRRGQQGGDWQGSLPVVHPHAAGIDVAAGSDLWAAIAPEPGRTAKETVHPFAPTTGGLRKLADWLAQEAITTVAFEATGIYWLPLYHLLSERGFQVIVVNPRDTRALRKKTDIADAQWLQYLHGTGLLKASFVPPAEILGMRGVWRHRDDLVRLAGSQVQHMQKALDEMNIKLHFFIDDLTGRTGLSILDAILAGERDPARLAKLRDYRCQAREEEIAAALEGQWLEHCLFILGQARAAWSQTQAQIAACDGLLEKQAIELLSHMGKPWEPEREKENPAGKEIKRRSKKANKTRQPTKNEPAGSAWPELCRALFGVDLMKVPGIGVGVVLSLLCEIGVVWTAFGSAGQLSSWMGLCPNNKVSGGKVIRRGVMPGQQWLRNMLRHAAASLARNESPLGDHYRRMRGRLGPIGANTVVAHKLARILWHLVTHQQEYDPSVLITLDAGRDARRLARLHRQAQALHLQLVPFPTPPTDPASTTEKAA